MGPLAVSAFARLVLNLYAKYGEKMCQPLLEFIIHYGYQSIISWDEIIGFRKNSFCNQSITLDPDDVVLFIDLKSGVMKTIGYLDYLEDFTRELISQNLCQDGVLYKYFEELEHLDKNFFPIFLFDRPKEFPREKTIHLLYSLLEV